MCPHCHGYSWLRHGGTSRGAEFPATSRLPDSRKSLLLQIGADVMDKKEQWLSGEEAIWCYWLAEKPSDSVSFKKSFSCSSTGRAQQ